MELKETVPLMISKDYKERFLAEYQQLIIRIEKLEVFLRKYKSDALGFTPNCPYNLLHEQLEHMQRYKIVLEERAKLEEIDIKEGGGIGKQ